MKSEIWIVSHCLGLSHKTIVCHVCVLICVVQGFSDSNMYFKLLLSNTFNDTQTENDVKILFPNRAEVMQANNDLY